MPGLITMGAWTIPAIFFDLIQNLVILCSVLRDLNSHEPMNSNYIPMPLASEVQEIAQLRNPRLMKIMNKLLIRSLWTREKTESGEKEVVGDGKLYTPSSSYHAARPHVRDS